MKKLKIALMSTAILIGVNHASMAAYTQSDLDTLRELTESRNTQALIRYIRANPQLTVGNDPLAAALRDFVESRSGVLGGVFGASVPDLAGVPDLPSGVQSSAQVSFGSLGDFGS